MLKNDIIRLLNNINASTQNKKLGENLNKVLDDLSKKIDNNSISVPEQVKTPKIKHHDLLDGAVNMQTLKVEFNSLIKDLIDSGLME